MNQDLTSGWQLPVRTPVTHIHMPDGRTMVRHHNGDPIVIEDQYGHTAVMPGTEPDSGCTQTFHLPATQGN